MTKREAVKAYKKIARKLERLHSDAADHISRLDNNRVFEISFYLRQVAKRINEKYEDTNYE